MHWYLKNLIFEFCNLQGGGRTKSVKLYIYFDWVLPTLKTFDFWFGLETSISSALKSFWWVVSGGCTYDYNISLSPNLWITTFDFDLDLDLGSGVNILYKGPSHSNKKKSVKFHTFGQDPPPKSVKLEKFFFHTSTETCFGKKSFQKILIGTPENLKKFQGFPPIWSKIVTFR